MSQDADKWSSGCNGPTLEECIVVSCPTGISTERWFKALPSRQFGPTPPIIWQQTTGLWIMEAPSQAREVIPQPWLSPNESQEIRRCLQFALLSRATRKPFYSPCEYYCLIVTGRSGESKPH